MNLFSDYSIDSNKKYNVEEKRKFIKKSKGPLLCGSLMRGLI